MSGYTEISDPVDNNNAHQEETIAPSDNYASAAPQYEDPFAEDPVPKSSNANNNNKTVTNAVEFDDSLNLGFVTKIMTYVGVPLAGCGLLVAFACGAAIPINPEWLSTIGCILPLMIMMLIATNRISHPLWYDIVVIVLSMVSAFYLFFRFIAFIQYPSSPEASNGVAAGDFIAFTGETLVCVASFLAQYGF